jgi:hypothetical protein
MRRAKGQIGAAALLVIGLLASEARADAPEAARWLSSDTVIYFESSTPAALWQRLADPRLRAPLMAVPEVKALLENPVLGKLRAVVNHVAGKLGMPPEKALASLTGGGLVLAIEVKPLREPTVCLVITPSEPTILKKANEAFLDFARRNADANGQRDPVTSAVYRGIREYQMGGDAAYAIVKDKLLITESCDTAELVIDRVLDGLKDQKPLTDLPEWSTRGDAVKADTVAWGFARLERLRSLDANKFGSGNQKATSQEILLLGAWFDALTKSPSISAGLDWSAERLALNVHLPVPAAGREAALKGFVPPKGAGAPPLLNVPGTIASVSLWRDLSAIWDARANLLPSDDVQKLAGLDALAGKFFDGRDFREGVLGALTDHWRAVAALQDYSKLDPAPDVKLPAFALIVDLKPDQDGFADRLKIAFQSLVGLANINATQTQGSLLELGSEKVEGVTISTSHFLPVKKGTGAKSPPAPVHLQHNFSPSVVQVGDQFVVSSSIGLARDLVSALKSPANGGHDTLVTAARGAALAQLVALNHETLVKQNMREQGLDKAQAERELDLLSSLLHYLGRARLVVKDTPDATTLRLEFALDK